MNSTLKEIAATSLTLLAKLACLSVFTRCTLNCQSYTFHCSDRERGGGERGGGEGERERKEERRERREEVGVGWEGGRKGGGERERERGGRD